MANQAEKLTEKQQKQILAYVQPFITMNPGLGDHRARLEHIDRLVERSYDTLKKKGCKDCNDKKEPDEENVTVPVVGPQVETITAQLAKIFLRTDPPVQMFASPTGSEIATQYNILYGQYSRKFQWRRNFLLCIHDAVKYNFCAAEVAWKSRVVREVKNQVSFNSGAMKSASAFEEGENIRYLHSYNVLWDGSVPVNEVASRGAYAGYIQKFTKIALYQFLRDEGIELTAEEKKNLTTNIPADIAGYYTPDINTVPSNQKASVSYDSLWEGKEKKTSFTSTELYNVYTLYVRIIPADFDIMSEDGADINILKLVLIGDSFIASAKLLDNAHNLFPIIFGQTSETALGLNSFTVAEELEPVQNTATKLYRTEIASARRMIADRAIYDPTMISEKDVNNPSPTAKIKLRQSLSQSVQMQQAYYAIPYEDRALGVRISQANQLLSFASPIAGTNPAMEGQFIKGNKSAQEFNSIMASAGDRVLMAAIFFDDQFLGPLRTILLADTLQYQNNIRVYNRDAGEFIDIDMAQLRDQPIDFEIAAGLIPADQMASLDFLQVIMQTIMSMPELNQEFKSVEAICYLAETKGVKYLTRFMRSAQERQEMQQQQLQMMQAQAQIQEQARNQGGQNAN